jgi:hypothetical protein
VLRAAIVVAVVLLGLAAAPGSPAISARVPVPASLKATESAAEDIVDYALSGNRQEAVGAAGTLRAAASETEDALIRVGVPSAAVRRLLQRAADITRIARRGSFVQIALAANAVSQLMPELYARFRDPVPPGILTLDYLDREAQLRSLARQPQKVAAAVRQLGRTWPGIRPKVVAAGGKREAAAYQAHVTAMKRIAPGAARRPARRPSAGWRSSTSSSRSSSADQRR